MTEPRPRPTSRTTAAAIAATVTVTWGNLVKAVDARDSGKVTQGDQAGTTRHRARDRARRRRTRTSSGRAHSCMIEISSRGSESPP